MRKKNQKGFTILELLIVVAVIGILVAIGLPKLLKARVSAIEGSGAAGARSAVTAILSFQTKFTNPPATFAALGGTGCDSSATVPTSTAACLMSDAWASTGVNNQYKFTYTTTGGDWALNVDPCDGTAPCTVTSPANRHYFANGEQIRYADGAAATATSTPLGN